MINVNIMSVVKMTQLVLPGMLERSRGIIINITSATALFPCALLSLYSASKAYIDFFSCALDIEYRSRGIIVQCNPTKRAFSSHHPFRPPSLLPLVTLTCKHPLSFAM
uniref:Uncharacterized protein n=1 Tax=Eptatretus burgeri TaxID=7764 RepID=A0A8C4QLR4_EPTBU